MLNEVLLTLAPCVKESGSSGVNNLALFGGGLVLQADESRCGALAPSEAVTADGEEAEEKIAIQPRPTLSSMTEEEREALRDFLARVMLTFPEFGDS